MNDSGKRYIGLDVHKHYLIALRSNVKAFRKSAGTLCTTPVAIDCFVIRLPDRIRFLAFLKCEPTFSADSLTANSLSFT
jgi:hypothetical protein